MHKLFCYISQFSFDSKIRVCYYLLKSRLYLKFDFLRRFSHSNVWSRAYAYINNLYRIFHYRTIKHESENIFKNFSFVKLNIEGYNAVSASVILLLSKMQQKPPKAAKAPYIQLLPLEGEWNFLMNFKGTNKWFSLKLHLKFVLSKKQISDLQINPYRYEIKVGGFCSILQQLDLSKAGT